MLEPVLNGRCHIAFFPLKRVTIFNIKRKKTTVRKKKDLEYKYIMSQNKRKIFQREHYDDEDGDDDDDDDEYKSESVYDTVPNLQEIITEAFNKLSMMELSAIHITNIDVGQILRQRFLLLTEQLHPLEYVLSQYNINPFLFKDIKFKVKVNNVTDLRDPAFTKSKLATNISHLVIDDEKHDLKVENLPKNLTQLVFLKLSSGFKGSIGGLSHMNNLKYLVAPSPWNLQRLPTSLTHLSICPSLTNVLKYIRLPTVLTHLEIRGSGSAFFFNLESWYNWAQLDTNNIDLYGLYS